MVAMLFALICALAYGTADFLGGLGARPVHVLRVLAVAAPAALAVQVACWPWLGAVWTTEAIVWGAASGIASVAASALLYRSLALGPMTMLSPLTAVISAALPVAVGLVDGEHPSFLAVAGIPLALVGVVLVTAGPGARWPSPTALTLAVGAGVAIAVQLVCLQRAPAGGGGAVLLTARAAACLVVFAALLRCRPIPSHSEPRLGVAAGALDAVAAVAFVLAVRAGDLTVVAVVVSLYPAATALLARTFLAERIARTQMAGLGVAAVALGLFALS